MTLTSRSRSEVKLSENHLNAITQAVIALVAASIYFFYLVNKKRLRFKRLCKWLWDCVDDIVHISNDQSVGANHSFQLFIQNIRACSILLWKELEFMRQTLCFKDQT